MDREARRKLIASLEEDLDEEESNKRKLSMKVEAAKRLSEFVVRQGKPMTLKALKEATMPRSSWEHFADVCLTGHRAGVLMMSRIDLRQLAGNKPSETGEITYMGSEFNQVKPNQQPGWKGP
jgi:hypothetical protein